MWWIPWWWWFHLLVSGWCALFGSFALGVIRLLCFGGDPFVEVRGVSGVCCAKLVFVHVGFVNVWVHVGFVVAWVVFGGV